MPDDRRFSKTMRLRNRADFRRIYERRCMASDQRLLVFGRTNEDGLRRLGLSVSRKVGNAVVRNRWKRRIREAFRLSAADWPAGLELIVIPRAAEVPEFSALRESLVRLAGNVARKLARPPRK
jgi:ribonuclease P protein component